MSDVDLARMDQLLAIEPQSLAVEALSFERLKAFFALIRCTYKIDRRGKAMCPARRNYR